MILLSRHLTLAIHNFLSYFLFLGKYIPPIPAGLYVQSKPCGHMDCALVIIHLTANIHIYCLILCVLIYSPRHGPTLTVSCFIYMLCFYFSFSFSLTCPYLFSLLGILSSFFII